MNWFGSSPKGYNGVFCFSYLYGTFGFTDVNDDGLAWSGRRSCGKWKYVVVTRINSVLVAKCAIQVPREFALENVGVSGTELSIPIGTAQDF